MEKFIYLRPKQEIYQTIFTFCNLLLYCLLTSFKLLILFLLSSHYIPYPNPNPIELQVNNNFTSLLLPSKVFNSVSLFLHRVSKIYHKIL